MPEIMGSGVVLFDFDADGDLDVYLPPGTLVDTTRRPADALFRHPPISRVAIDCSAMI